MVRFRMAVALCALAFPFLVQAQEQTAPAKHRSGTVGETGQVEAPIGAKSGVIPPKLLSSALPEYSKKARRKKINGDVQIRLVVDEQGMPQDVTVEKGVGYGLDESAVEAVKKYRFAPATKDGNPVKVDLRVSVHFQIF